MRLTLRALAATWSCLVAVACAAGCGAPYVGCCRSCTEAYESFRPFEGSACFTEAVASMLRGVPA